MFRLIAPVFAVAIALTGAALFGVPSNTQGQDGAAYTANATPLNMSGVNGTATASLDGTQLTVTINATGLAPGLPHAQHLHIGGMNNCPTISQDGNGDGLVTTSEGLPNYGPIMVSLTTSGDVSDDSGLAVDRFPSAASDGTLTYTRTFELPPGVTAAAIADAVVVQHGIDLDDSGEYDGDLMSDLDPTLPEEATIPADCGKLTASAAGASTPAGGSTPAAGSTATAGSTPRSGGAVAAPNTGTGPGSGGGTSWVLLATMGALVVGGVVAFGAARTQRG